jgi:hypothetical protein
MLQDWMIIIRIRWLQHSHQKSGCCCNFPQRQRCNVVAAIHSTHWIRLLDAPCLKPMSTYMPSAIATKLREKAELRLWTQCFASPVGIALPKAATMETAMNWFRNSGRWPAGRCVFTDADFAPSMVTDRPETVRLEERNARYWTFQLEFCILAKPTNPKQTSSYNELNPVWKIAHWLQTPQKGRTQNQERNTASGKVLTVTPRKESLNRPNISGSSGAQLEMETLSATAKAMAQIKQKSSDFEETRCLFCGER